MRISALAVACALALALVTLLVPPPGSSAATLYLESMNDAFEPDPCLPLTLQPVIFEGPYCDGALCPPDPLVSGCGGSGVVTQFSLTGILQDAALSVVRQATVQQDGAWAGSASARLRPDLHLAEVSTSDPNGTSFYLRYGSGTWDLNLVSLVATNLRVPVLGTISPTQPLYCMVQMIDRSASFRYASLTVVATAPETLVLPIASFFTFGGFDFTHVDDINLAFMDCQFGCATIIPARQYAVGPIVFDASGSTAANSVSWGRVKTIYR